MKLFLSRHLIKALTALVTLSTLSTAHAQDTYPSKPVRVVVPFPAGGATDILTRGITEKLAVRLNQPVIVENKPGGGANIGAAFVAKAPADGYTLLMGSVGSHSIAQTYYKNPGYDIRKDLVPVSAAGTLGNAIFVAPDFPANNVAELVKLAKAKPGELTCGSSGTGGLIHLTCEMFKSKADINVLHVPYKGTSLLIPDLLSGRVSITLDTIPPYLQLLKTGKVKVLAVTTKERSPLLPEVPTIAESGYPGFDSLAVYGFFAPAGTSPAIINKLNKEINLVLLDTELKSKLFELGIEIKGSTPEDLQLVVNDQVQRWGDVIRNANIKPE